MKKWVALATAATLLLGGGSAYAHDDGKGKDKKDKWKSDKEWRVEIDDCRFVPPGLLKAKNDKAKAAVEANIVKKCGKDGWGKEWDKDWDKDWDKNWWKQWEDFWKNYWKNYWNNGWDQGWNWDWDGQDSPDQQQVAQDKASLRIGFSGNDSERSVTGPLVLPTVGAKGSTITWKSSNANVISHDGKTVVRPSADTWVRLTATIKSNNAQETKSFWVIVKKAAASTDAEKVAADKAKLEIDFGGTDTAQRVTVPFDALPSKGANGSAITWASGAPSIISNDGKTVVRPPAGSGEATVIMIATIRSGSAVDTKIFEVKVQPRLADAEAVAGDKAKLEIDFGGSDTAERVTRPFDKLPTVGVNGSAITWTSGNPAVISNDGKTVNRPASDAPDTPVIMTAFIRSGNVTDTKVFVLTVANQFTAEETVDADKADLAIGFAEGNSATEVTHNLTLPVKGYYGSEIAWYSSNPEMIDHDGKLVKRPAKGSGDAEVTLTALLHADGATEWKAFKVVVKALQ